MKRNLLLILLLALMLSIFSTGFAGTTNGIQSEPRNDAPPLAPLLLTPLNGEQVFGQHRLQWTLPPESPAATGYDLYIDDMLVSSNYINIHHTSLGMHTWYVIARNESGESAPSEVRTFERVEPVIVGLPQTNGSPNPFSSYTAYGRSLALYTADQIGQLGVIDGFGWEVVYASGDDIPYKIYIKTTTASALTSMTWAEFTSTATLIKEGNKSFNHWPQNYWYTLRLDTPFTYTGGNLLIGVETNFGPIPHIVNSHCPYFRYTQGSANVHQYWQGVYGPPTNDGSLNANLPNLAIMFKPLAVQATVSGSNLMLQWNAVPGATSYKVYASDDPYNFGTDPIATVNTNSYTMPATDPRRFFKVTFAFEP